MSKKFLSRLLFWLVLLVPAVLWLLNVIGVKELEFFNLSWAIVIACGGVGILFILRGLFEKNISTLKKFSIMLGSGLLVIALLVLIPAIAAPKNYLWPIIAIIVVGMFILMLFATGGRKWDEGDNKKVGYKNYYQRKEEEERKKAEEEKKNKQ